MHKPSLSAFHLTKGKLAAAALSVAGVLSAADAKAEPQNHKGVMAIAGTTANQILAHVIDLECDTNKDSKIADLKTCKATAKVAYQKEVGPSDKQSWTYVRFISGRNLFAKEFATTVSQNNKPGLHVYYDLGNEAKNTSDLLFGASSAQGLDENDRFNLSVGSIFNQDEITARDDLDMNNLRTYTIVRDNAGRVAGLKLKAKTDTSKEIEMLDGYNDRIWRDMHVTTYEILGVTEKDTQYGIQLRKKDTQGVWKLVYDKKLTDSAEVWSGDDAFPIIDAPDGKMEMSIFNPSTGKYAVYDVSSGMKIEELGTTPLRRFGKNYEYKLYKEKSSGQYVVVNAKGETVKLPVELNSGFSLFANGFRPLDDNTYLTGSSTDLVILRVTENPFNVESALIKTGITSVYKKSRQLIGTDGDNDFISSFTDNCDGLPNTSQHDENGNAIGDSCDASPAKTGDKQFEVMDVLSGSGYRLLYNATVKSAGQLVVSTNGTGNTIMPNLPENIETTFWVVPNGNKTVGVVNFKIPAGYTFSVEAFDGGFMMDSKPVKGSMTTDKEIVLSTTPFTNARLTLKKNTVVVQPEPAPDTSGSEPDASDSDVMAEGVEETSGEDAIQETMVGPDAVNDDIKVTADAAGTDTQPIETNTGVDALVGSEIKSDAGKVTPPKTTPPPKDGCMASPTSSSEQSPVVPLILTGAALVALSRRRVKVTLANNARRVA